MKRWKLDHRLVLGSTYGIVAVGLFLDWMNWLPYIILAGWFIVQAGYRVARDYMHLPLLESMALSPLLSLAILIPPASLVYMVIGVPTAVCALLLLIPLIVGITVRRKNDVLTKENKHRMRPSIIGLGIFLASHAVILTLLSRYATTRAVLGPWDVLQPNFWIAYAIASLMLCTLLVRSNSKILTILCLSIHAGISYSIATVLFPLGFGFDPLIHQAAERVIVAYGSIEPKTFYYVGHYVITALLSKLSGLDPSIIDPWLVPLLASITLPALAYHALGHYFQWNVRERSCGALSLLFLTPFAFAIGTTPWAFASLLAVTFVLCTLLFFADNCKEKLLICILIALAACAVHPLVGLPLASMAAWLFFTYGVHTPTHPLLQRILSTSIVLGGSVIVPLAFAANALLSPSFSLAWDGGSLGSLFSFLSLPEPLTSWRFNPPLDFAYLFYGSALLFIGVLLVGVWAYRKFSGQHIHALLGAPLLCMINFAIMAAALRFPGLPPYEQEIYASRLLNLALMCSLPLFALGSVTLFNRAHTHHRMSVRLASFFLIPSLMMASLYLSYPRNDAYASFHGFSVSADDIAAVRAIAEDAMEDGYIVLSNQVVASAAIREFGFKKYYPLKGSPKESAFYYSIPAGSPLHSDFRRLIEYPNREHVIRAMDRVGVSRAYVVITPYEDRVTNVIAALKKNADSTLEVGKDIVFRFDIE